MLFNTQHRRDRSVICVSFVRFQPIRLPFKGCFVACFNQQQSPSILKSIFYLSHYPQPPLWGWQHSWKTYSKLQTLQGLPWPILIKVMNYSVFEENLMHIAFSTGDQNIKMQIPTNQQCTHTSDFFPDLVTYSFCKVHCQPKSRSCTDISGSSSAKGGDLLDIIVIFLIREGNTDDELHIQCVIIMFSFFY